MSTKPFPDRAVETSEDGYFGMHHPDDILEDRCPTHAVKLRMGCDENAGGQHRPDGSAYCPVDDCPYETDAETTR